MAKKKSDLIPRVITAVVAIPLLLLLILKGPAWGFFILIAAAGAISAWEYCNITFNDELPIAKWAATLLTPGLMSVMYFAPNYLLQALSAGGVLLFLLILFGHKEQEKTSTHLGASMMAIIYAGLIFGCLALTRKVTGDAGSYWVVVILAIIWGSDTGAYFAGRFLGKHKLSPKVSPNKTIEGAMGGLITSVLFTFGFNFLFTKVGTGWVELNVWQVFLVAIPGNILGQTGDLCESLIKRAHGVKDSGTIIYGHGGMLDRIDALILASPWFYIFVTTWGPQATNLKL